MIINSYLLKKRADLDGITSIIANIKDLTNFTLENRPLLLITDTVLRLENMFALESLINTQHRRKKICGQSLIFHCKKWTCCVGVFGRDKGGY